MAEVKNVNNLMKLFSAIEELALCGKAVMKDGKLTAEDLQHLPLLIAKHETLIAGFSNLGECVAEAKDISLEECVLIVNQVVAISKKVSAA